MNKLGQFLLAGAVFAGCIVSAVAADQSLMVASLDDISGKILVNKGKGFVSAQPGMEVRPGDRVIALDNASARVVYKNGCVTSLKENSLLAMDGSGCEKKPVNSRANDIKLAVAIGGEVVNPGTNVPPPVLRTVPLGGVSAQGAAGAFGLLGGGVLLHAALNDNKPVSGQ